MTWQHKKNVAAGVFTGPMQQYCKHYFLQNQCLYISKTLKQVNIVKFKTDKTCKHYIWMAILWDCFIWSSTVILIGVPWETKNLERTPLKRRYRRVSLNQRRMQNVMEIPTDCNTQCESSNPAGMHESGCTEGVRGVVLLAGQVRLKDNHWRGGRVEVDFGRSLGFRNAIPVHEVFKPGGKICHNSRGSQVKRPLEVLLVIQHPNVDLKPDARTHTSHHGRGSHMRLKNASVVQQQRLQPL